MAKIYQLLRIVLNIREIEQSLLSFQSPDYIPIFLNSLFNLKKQKHLSSKLKSPHSNQL